MLSPFCFCRLILSFSIYLHHASYTLQPTRLPSSQPTRQPFRRPTGNDNKSCTNPFFAIATSGTRHMYHPHTISTSNQTHQKTSFFKSCHKDRFSSFLILGCYLFVYIFSLSNLLVHFETLRFLGESLKSQANPAEFRQVNRHDNLHDSLQADPPLNPPINPPGYFPFLISPFLFPHLCTVGQNCRVFLAPLCIRLRLFMTRAMWLFMTRAMYHDDRNGRITRYFFHYKVRISLLAKVMGPAKSTKKHSSWFGIKEHT